MLLALPLVILGSALAVTASIAPDAHNQVTRHHRLARTPEPVPDTPTTKLRKRKSCKAPTSKSTAPKSSTKKKPTSTKKAEAAKATSNAKSNFAASDGSTSSSAKGLIKVQASRCGDNGASTKISNTKGPNGSLDWLNCGVEDGGWNPPFIGVDDVVATDLSEALKSPSSPFHACAPYLDIFYDAAGKYGLKPIMLAAFAMQESSCNKNTVGGGGEQGLMQITQEKCDGAPGGNCRDPWFNIHTGAKFFAKTLDSNNGNLLLSLGNYNGWYKGLTVAKATAARYTSCCRCQNNLDYLHQWMNGWILNQNAYALSLGRYHNLDVCGH